MLKESKNNKDNIFYLLKEKRNKSESDDLNTALNDGDELKDEIKSVLDLRDKFYAHLDKDYSAFLGERFKVEKYYDIFSFIEKSISAIGHEKDLQKTLELIPSRDEFHLDLK